MPQWLVDNKVQFCGSSREEMATRAGRDDGVVSNSLCVDQSRSRLVLVGLVTFSVGYFVGRKKNRSADVKKN
jgi:hypothetical protein